MTILTDSREQKPYEFKTPSGIGTLSCGDYSIQGLQDYISIERKSLPDLIASLSNGRDRFERELYRGKSLDYFCLVIECSLSDIIEHKYKSQMEPKAAIQSLLAFSIRYRLPVWFCESRQYGQRVTESLLLKYANEIEKRYECIEGKK